MILPQKTAKSGFEPVSTSVVATQLRNHVFMQLRFAHFLYRIVQAYAHGSTDKKMRMYMPINMYMQNHTDAAHTKTKGAKKFQRYQNSQGRSSWSFLVSCDLANTFVRRRCRANRRRQLRQTLAQASGQRCSLQTPERTTRAANTKLGEILTGQKHVQT